MPTHVITGAGAGIGAALAGMLAGRGDDLVLVVRSKDRAEELRVRFPGARMLVADLADPAGIGAALDEQGAPERVDSLVHAAGVVELGGVGEMRTDVWAQTLDVNLRAPAELTRALLPQLRAARGTVVFVNSGSGLRANPTWSAYAASKHGLRALADALRAEEQDSGVRVTSVYPGRVATGMQEKVHAQEGKAYDPADWIAPESVATTILGAIDLPRDAEMTDVTVRPGPR
jgi:NADP-dependent 3-hydroxy acid dehydrogenase YdfG